MDPQHVPDEAAPPPARSKARSYLLVWLALLVLTVLTIVAGRADLGRANVLIALGIAGTKAVLVALFFMHLLHTEGANRLVIATSVVFVGLLVLGVIGDYAFRLPTALPPTRPF